MNDELSEKVIGAAFKVHNELGFGFLESVYEKALSIELTKLGIRHQRQCPIKVMYDDQVVGEFECDILVEDSLILELKSVRQLATAHEVQFVNWRRLTRFSSSTGDGSRGSARQLSHGNSDGCWPAPQLWSGQSRHQAEVQEGEGRD